MARDENGNVILEPEYTQVCIWQGATLGKSTHAEFTAFVAASFAGSQVQYLEEVRHENGRIDLLFAIRNEDIGKFAVRRLASGIRWLEDVYGYGYGHLYPARCAHYRCWDDRTPASTRAQALQQRNGEGDRAEHVY